MNNSTRYRNDHVLAKGVVLVLYLTIGIISIEMGSPYLSLLVGTPVWFFGINSIGYLVEHLFGHEHVHNRI